MAERYDWQTGMNKLVQRTSFLLRSSWRTDVEFSVGLDAESRIIKGHKLILAMGSPVFDAMLFGSMAERTDMPIRIPDIHPDAFAALLEYMYTDEVSLRAVDAAVEICYAAKKYMPQLVRRCTQFVWKDLSASNACRAFEFAKLFCVQFLVDKCLQVFRSDTECVLRCDDFLDVTPETLCTILSLDEMNVRSEKVVFDATLSWGRQQCQRKGHQPSAANLRAQLTEAGVLFLVRYLAMSPADFIASAGVSGLFSDEEVLAILMNISVPGTKAMPMSLKAVSQNSKQRNRSRKRYYCALSYPACPETRVQMAQAPVITELRLFVDRDIFLHGVVFNGQSRSAADVKVDAAQDDPINGKDPERTESDYREHVLLQLCSADCEPMVETRLSERVRWDEKVEVNFQCPFLVRRHTGYVLRITFGSVGTYRKYTELMGPSQNDGIHITCSYMNGFLVAVHTIVFSCSELP